MFRSIIAPLLVGLLWAAVFVAKGFLQYFSAHLYEADYLAGVSYNLFHIVIAVVGNVFFAGLIIILVFTWINRNTPFKGYIASFIAVGSAFVFFYIATLSLQSFGIDHIQVGFRANTPPWPGDWYHQRWHTGYIIMLGFTTLLACWAALILSQAQVRINRIWATLGLFITTYKGMVFVALMVIDNHHINYISVPPGFAIWYAPIVGNPLPDQIIVQLVGNPLPNPIYEHIVAIAITTIVFAIGLNDAIKQHKTSSVI